MLTALDIRDMLIIDHLELDFKSGLNVLTGETGAGKSILLDSLGFVLGWRGRADLVREGADQGEVTACFFLAEGHPAHAILAEAGLPGADEGEIILRRVNSRDGRKTAFVNDRRVSGDVLRQLSETLVELHGQHDDRGLLNPRGHRQLLDSFGGLDTDIGKTRRCWSDWRKALKVVEDAETALEAARAEEDYLRHAVAELTELAPEAGEDAALDARRRLMQGAEKLREGITRASVALGGEGAESLLHDARRWIEDGAETLGAAGEEPLAALGRCLAELGEAQDGVQRLLQMMEFDPSELERIEERLFAIRGLARKHQIAPDDLAGLAGDLGQRLVALDASVDDLPKLQDAAKVAEAAYEDMAEKLRSKRQKAARALDKAMGAELAPLKMERAVFTTEVTAGEAGPDGSDAVQFTVATNPGAPAGALNKIASGGELSRFLLALKVCLTRDVQGLTLIFDEIDRGVGGATADAVGRRLASLADGAQVLVVTHSPQVAALGNHHWRVEKQVSKGVTLSQVVPLAAPDRVDEIARMLAGDTVTNEARAAARALLDA